MARLGADSNHSWQPVSFFALSVGFDRVKKQGKGE